MKRYVGRYLSARQTPERKLKKIREWLALSPEQRLILLYKEQSRAFSSQFLLVCLFFLSLLLGLGSKPWACMVLLSLCYLFGVALPSFLSEVPSQEDLEYWHYKREKSDRDKPGRASLSESEEGVSLLTRKMEHFNQQTELLRGLTEKSLQEFYALWQEVVLLLRTHLFQDRPYPWNVSTAVSHDLAPPAMVWILTSRFLPSSFKILLTYQLRRGWSFSVVVLSGLPLPPLPETAYSGSFTLRGSLPSQCFTVDFGRSFESVLEALEDCLIFYETASAPSTERP